MKVLLHGCNGRMGQVLSTIISEAEGITVVCGVDRDPERFSNPYPVYSSLDEVLESPDVVIDFSNRLGLKDLIRFGTSRKTPLVICTTGFTPEDKSAMHDASKDVAILHSANMSIGVNLLLSLVRQAASALHDGFDIEIIEKHHNLKADSPSGTALMIADAINESLEEKLDYVYGRHSKTERRRPSELGIHAVRGGSIVGEHDVIFAGAGEVIEINHSALSRDVFAHGAIRAARFLVNKSSGFYTMKDVIE